MTSVDAIALSSALPPSVLTQTNLDIAILRHVHAGSTVDTERDSLRRYLDFRSSSPLTYGQLLAAEECEQGNDDSANEQYQGEQSLPHQSQFNRPWEVRITLLATHALRVCYI